MAELMLPKKASRTSSSSTSAAALGSKRSSACTAVLSPPSAGTQVMTGVVHPAAPFTMLDHAVPEHTCTWSYAPCRDHRVNSLIRPQTHHI